MSTYQAPSSIEGYERLAKDLLNSSEDDRWNISRLLCRTDTFWLLWAGCGRKDVAKPWLLERCKEFDANPDGYVDLWSRDHYKSTIITYGGTIRSILASHGDDPMTDREQCIGIFSHTRPIAKGFLRQIKYEFETNGSLKELFPDILWSNPHKEAPKWSEDDGITVRRKSNPKEATLEAWGLVDGQPTSRHFTGMVYDDVVTRESVTTPEMIDKTTQAVELSFNLGSQGAEWRRMIGTRYHFNDSYGTMIARGVFKPRIHTATEDGTPDGEPVLLSREQLQNKRRDMGPYIFACQMLQNPKADETQGFHPDWLKYHDGIKPQGLNVYLLFDPAGSKNKKSDYTAGWVVGLGPDENLYILDMVRDRFNLTQRAKLVMDWHKKYKPMRADGVRYEKYGLMADIEHIQSIQKAVNYRFEITEVGGTLPKNDRIKRLIPYFEQGRVYLPRTLWYTGADGKTTDLIQDFIEQEFKAFPVPIHDDMLDALARIAEPDIPLVFPQLEAFRTEDLEPAYYED